MKAQLLSVGALAALGVAWWLWGGGAALGGAPLQQPDGGAARRASSADSVLQSAPQQMFDREAVDPATAPPGSLPPEVFAAVRLEIVDVRGAPVHDADVLYLPPMSDEARRTAEHDPEVVAADDDDEVLLQRYGRSARPDDNGFVDLTIATDSAVVARRGDDFAIAWPDPAEPGMPRRRMLLRPDVTLRVLVVDDVGTPIPGVGLFAASFGRSHRRGVFGFDTELGPTDAAGGLMLRHLQEELELPSPDVDGELRLRLGGRYESRDRDLPTLSVPASRLRGDVIVRLVAPRCGVIVVRPCDADGGPVSAAARLTFADGAHFERSADHDHDTMRFAPVPLGERWRVVVDSAGLPAASVSQAVAGPRQTGETVRVDVRLPQREFRVHARVVDASGAAVPRATAKVTSPQLPQNPAEFRADDDGDLRLGSLFVGEAATRLDLTVTVTSPLTEPRTFVFILPEKGAHDLGDLVVDRRSALPLLAAVELHRDGQPLTEHCGAELTQVVTEGSWQRREPVPAVLDQDGARFEFRGPIPTQPMRLVCWSEDGVRRVIEPVPPGARRVVELARCADLILAIEAPDVPHNGISAWLTPLADDGEGPAEVLEEGLEEEQQAFWWSGVAPGRYALRVAIADRELWSCASLELRPGVNRLPADGARLDLRDRAAARLLRVCSASDGGAIGYEALAVAPDATGLPAAEDRREVWQWFLLQAPRKDLLVMAPRHAPARVAAPSDDVELRLQPCTELELDVEGDYDRIAGRLLHDPTTDPLLRAFDEYGVHTRGPDVVFDAEDVELWFAPGAVVELWVEREERKGTPVRVTVGDSTPQVVRLR
ncbi:MAG: hypothetical protein H6835_03210 [Planctomycetes bacterium]|nr:hypothetical protein [Planctomycetota bacterium]